MRIAQKNFSISNIQVSKVDIFGFTIVELMIALAVVGVLSMVAVPAYQDYSKRVEAGDAEKDLIVLQLAIDDFELTNGNLPNTLADVGMGGMMDPWGNPYVYGNHAIIPPGHRRKDHALVPINSDYDLYSKGEDGASVPPLTGNPSKDDIIRGSDGAFMGLATDY